LQHFGPDDAAVAVPPRAAREPRAQGDAARAQADQPG
jgi:hypothetical protein